MNEGILEQINAKIDNLLLLVAALAGTPAGVPAAGAAAPPGVGGSDFDQAFESAKDDNVDKNGNHDIMAMGLDKEDCYWAPHMHSGTPGKTTKEIWKKRKGGVVDKAVGMAEWAKKYPTEAAAYKAKSQTIPGTPAPGAGAPPGVNPSAGAAAPPGVNPSAGSAAPPAPVADGLTPQQKLDKVETMSHIAVLADEMAVPYPFITKALSDNYGASSFDELPVEQYAASKELFTNWVGMIKHCNDEISKIVTMGADNGQAGVNTLLTNNGVSAVNECANYDAVELLFNDLMEYRIQWDSFVAQ